MRLTLEVTCKQRPITGDKVIYTPHQTPTLPPLTSMETWFIIILTFCIAALIKPLFLRRSHRNKLPPGPSFFSSNFILLTNSLSALEPILVNLKSKYGPLITLTVGSRPSIFVGDHSLAHQILIQKGAVFSDRPRTFAVRNISSSSYGPTWRLLRRNLASEVLHPSRVKSYSWARKWVLQILINRLRESEDQAAGIKVVDHFQYAMFCLLVLMCFGEKLEENQINEIATVQRRLLLLVGSGRFNILGVFPRLGKILFRNRWKDLLQIRHDQEQTLLPLIKSRIESLESKPENENERIVAYVDTLVNLNLPIEDGGNENNGKLTHKEMVSMCGEFLNAGTDTTSTALQWIMANVVKNPDIQKKLYDEIVAVVGPPRVEAGLVINEDEIEKMRYLKAVVLEGLRRHPPGHFVLPHRVMKEVEVQGYVIPQGATINFMVGEMGLDPTVWDDPMEFKPERFLVDDDGSNGNGVFDISGSKGIKMMPFGAGRRICPGSDLALLHLEYFVANLIWYFHWGVPDGYNVDLSEKVEFTIVMKNPLQARITSRVENQLVESL